MKTKTRSTNPERAAEDAANFWLEQLSNDEIAITSGDLRGGIRLANGKPVWWARDSDGEIDPVEQIRHCGSQQVISNMLRGERPGVRRRVTFAPPAPPQSDGFFLQQPKHALSIHQRPALVINLSDRRQIGLIRNGFPFVAEGHFLGFWTIFDGNTVEYPWVEQSLTRENVALILDLARALRESYAVAFNPPFYGATQLQLHLHVTAGSKYPVENAVRMRLEGCDLAFAFYPATCLIIENASIEAVFGCIGRFAAENIATNLLVRGQTVYVFPRRAGVGAVPEFPSGIAAFSELGGRWICSDRQIFAALEEYHLRTTHRKVTVEMERAAKIAAG